MNWRKQVRSQPHPESIQVEQSLWRALDRLKSGKPSDPRLVKCNQQGILKLSIAAVAQEDGRSRTLIGHDKCTYPAVRAAILAQMAASWHIRSTRTSTPTGVDTPALEEANA